MNKSYDPLASVQAAGPPGSISFIFGLPDPETFPVSDLKHAFEIAFREKADLALQYGPEQGYGPLIDYLREKIRLGEGIAIERPQITLSGGASQALDHLCTLFSRSGDVVIVEAPTYRDSIQLFRNHGLQPLQIPIDDEGLNVEELKSSLEILKDKGKRVCFLYTIPTFQNPSGITLSDKRKKAILNLAKEMDLLIVEDDVYFDIAYEEIKAAPLFLLAEGKNVVRLGSFSKIISPGLRLGWTVGPADIINQLIQCGLRNMGGGANPLIAIAMAIYCQRGLLEPHIESLRTIYKKRRDIMLNALKALMPDGIGWTQPKGGFFIWLTLPPPLRAMEVRKLAKQEGIYLLAGDPFFAEDSPGEHMRLAFSYVQPQKILEGIEKLAEIIKSHL